MLSARAHYVNVLLDGVGTGQAIEKAVDEGGRGSKPWLTANSTPGRAVLKETTPAPPGSKAATSAPGGLDDDDEEDWGDWEGASDAAPQVAVSSRGGAAAESSSSMWNDLASVFGAIMGLRPLPESGLRDG